MDVSNYHLLIDWYLSMSLRTCKNNRGGRWALDFYTFLINIF